VSTLNNEPSRDSGTQASGRRSVPQRLKAFWHRSGGCLEVPGAEVAVPPDGIALRDTKNPSSPQCTFTRYEASDFVERIQTGRSTIVNLGSDIGTISDLRVRKTPAELEALRLAADAIDRVHARMGEWLRAGQTEREVGQNIVDAIVAEGHARSREPSAVEKWIASATLSLASFIAMGVREQARTEWIGEQSAIRAGALRSPAKRLRFSVGLIRGALQIRASRVAAPGIDLLDRVARSETRTYRAVGLVVFATACYVFHTQGLAGVIADGESLFVEGGALYGAARCRRKTLKDRDEISGEDADSGSPPDAPE